MPATPFHYPFAFLISKTNKRFLLPGLVVGSVIPDIEIPIMWVFFPGLPDHLVLHSLIGGLTLGVLLAVIVTCFLYTPIASFVFRIDSQDLKQTCQVNSWMLLSCLFGVMSHLILDFPMHWYNPILWPWVDPMNIVGPLVLVFMPTYDLWTSYLIASAITHVVMLALWSGIIVRLYSKGNLWYRHWVKDFPLDSQSISERYTTSFNRGKPLL
jgi:hypothetical protein